MESQGIFPVDRGWPKWKWLERKNLLWHGNGLVMFHGSFDCVFLAPSIFYTSSRKMTMEELFKHSKLMTSSKNYNQWICILYPVPSCSIHCPHHIPSAWNGEGCFHQGHGTVDPMEFRSTPLLEDRQEATFFRSFWNMPKLGGSQKSRELMKWMLFLRLRCFEHVYERQRIYTKLHPTIIEAAFAIRNDEVHQWHANISTRLNCGSTELPWPFDGPSNFSRIPTSAHHHAPCVAWERRHTKAWAWYCLCAGLCFLCWNFRENYDVDVLVLSRCSYKAHQRFGVQDGSIQCLQRYANWSIRAAMRSDELCRDPQTDPGGAWITTVGLADQSVDD